MTPIDEKQRQFVKPRDQDPPVTLAGVDFVSIGFNREHALRGGELVGTLDWDDVYFTWEAQKRRADGTLGNMRPMRCRAEARAFICSPRAGWFITERKRAS